MPPEHHIYNECVPRRAECSIDYTILVLKTATYIARSKPLRKKERP